MDEIETIGWQDVVGNRFNKSLEPAMLSEAGYTRLTTIRRTGDAGKMYFKIHHDRDYVIAFISKTICNPLFSLGKKQVLDLVDEAWVYTYPNSMDKTYGSRIKS